MRAVKIKNSIIPWLLIDRVRFALTLKIMQVLIDVAGEQYTQQIINLIKLIVEGRNVRAYEFLQVIYTQLLPTYNF